MDVYCAKCGEGWSMDHMLLDEVYETDLPVHFKKIFKGKLDSMTRKAFEAIGWKFIDNNVLAIAQCPACKDQPNTKTSKAKAELLSAMCSVLGDDADGLVSELNDLGPDFGGLVNRYKLIILTEDMEKITMGEYPTYDEAKEGAVRQMEMDKAGRFIGFDVVDIDTGEIC